MKIRPFSPAGKKSTRLFFCLFGNHDSAFAQNFHGPLFSQNQTLVTIFGWGNLLFGKNEPITFENSSLLACWKEIHQFLGDWFENHDSVFAKTFHGPSVWHVRWKFLVEAICLLDKTNQYILNFLIKSQVAVDVQILHYSSESWNITPLYFYKLKHDILTRKGTHQSENLENFECSVHNSHFFLSFRKSENLHFHGLFLSKVYKIWTKKYTGVIFHDTDRWCKALFVVSKMAWQIC